MHVCVLPRHPFPFLLVHSRFCSIDGDADRLVYFAPCAGASPTTCVSLLDGDKILVLVAIFIRDLLQQLPEGVAADVQVQVLCISCKPSRKLMLPFMPGLPKVHTVVPALALYHLPASLQVGLPAKGPAGPITSLSSGSAHRSSCPPPWLPAHLPSCLHPFRSCGYIPFLGSA